VSILHGTSRRLDQSTGDRSITLAVLLEDRELLAIVERLASDRSAVVALLADRQLNWTSAVLGIQQWARDRLAGIPLEGNFVRRPPK